MRLDAVLWAGLFLGTFILSQIESSASTLEWGLPLWATWPPAVFVVVRHAACKTKECNAALYAGFYAAFAVISFIDIMWLLELLRGRHMNESGLIWLPVPIVSFLAGAGIMVVTFIINKFLRRKQ